MKHNLVTAALLASSLILTACGGGGGSSSSKVPESVNQSPVIASIVNQSMNEKSSLNISADASDSDGTIVNYFWEQTSGVDVVLTNTDTAEVSLTAPSIDSDGELMLKLTVTDNDGASSSVDFKVNINAFPAMMLGEGKFGEAELG